MKNKKKYIKEDRGITLIALVITIIVLLILAGISIIMLTGNNGILTQANKAKDETEQGTLEEEVRLKVNERETDKYIGGERSLEEYLKEIEGASVEKLIEDAYLVKRGEAEVTVYEDGDIEKGKVEIWDGESTEVPEIKEFNWNIYNGAQLKFLADFVNNGNKLTEEQKVQVAEEGYQESDIVLNENTTVNLMNNIDLGARQENGELTSGTQWKQIGKFVAIFNGNDYSIKGVYVKQEENFAGLIKSANIIKNLTIKDSYVEGTNCMGGITGMANTMENCHNENTTIIQQEGNYYAVGGVVGQINKNGNISNCSNTGNIFANGNNSTYGSACGGIVGYALNGSIVDNCYNRGEINGKGSYVGGITGSEQPNSIVKNCYNLGEINGEENYVGGITGACFSKVENSYNVGKIKGVEQVGGIIGATGEVENIIISNCYNTGEVIGNIGLGGIAGAIFGKGTIENNYNKGKIIGIEGIGGIIGGFGNLDSIYTITKCYSKGEVEGENQIGAVIGKILNENNINNISSLYYLNTIGVKGIDGKDYEGKTIGVEDDINSYEEFIGWIENK